MAPNYANLTLYKIECNDPSITDAVYVGATVNFAKRKSRHRDNCVHPANEKYHIKVYRRIRECGGWDNFTMTAIEAYPCATAELARARERFYYDSLNSSLNTVRPFRAPRGSWSPKSK